MGGSRRLAATVVVSVAIALFAANASAGESTFPPLPLPTLTLPPLIKPPPSSSTPLPPPPAQDVPKPPGAEKLPVALGPADTRPGPGTIFTLEARSMTLSGTRYHGVANSTVHLAVNSARIDGLVMRSALPGGRILVTAAPGVGTISAGTISGATTDMYIEEFTGTLNVAGLPAVPVTLSGRSLLTPGVDLSFLTLPQLTFTDVTARIVLIRGGNLHIPEARLTVN